MIDRVYAVANDLKDSGLKVVEEICSMLTDPFPRPFDIGNCNFANTHLNKCTNSIATS